MDKYWYGGIFPVLRTVNGTQIRLSSCIFHVVADFVYLEQTSLTGDLDSIFCDTTPGTHHLQANCGGDDPEVTCSCCTRCCIDDSRFCPLNIEQVCKNYAFDWEVNKFQGMASCTCASDSLSFSCTFGDCETCNKDSTVCGMTTAFEFLLTPTGLFDSLSTSFQYTKGRSNDDISWEDFTGGSCKVSVNGTECTTCTSNTACPDGYVGFYIDCRNALHHSFRTVQALYSSCFPEEGGVLDVFGWMDRESWTGCPLVSLRELLL